MLLKISTYTVYIELRLEKMNWKTQILHRVILSISSSKFLQTLILESTKPRQLI